MSFVWREREREGNHRLVVVVKFSAAKKKKRTEMRQSVVNFTGFGWIGRATVMSCV